VCVDEGFDAALILRIQCAVIETGSSVQELGGRQEIEVGCEIAYSGKRESVETEKCDA
jgi:hypothetical protein